MLTICLLISGVTQSRSNISKSTPTLHPKMQRLRHPTPQSRNKVFCFGKRFIPSCTITSHVETCVRDGQRDRSLRHRCFRERRTVTYMEPLCAGKAIIFIQSCFNILLFFKEFVLLGRCWFRHVAFGAHAVGIPRPRSAQALGATPNETKNTNKHLHLSSSWNVERGIAPIVFSCL